MVVSSGSTMLRQDGGADTKTSRGRILVVEDEALIALDLERRLIRAGYDVVGVADNRDEALELFREHQPQLVLMDIFIRGQHDGIETAKAIGQFSDVPVIFLTAYADDDTVRRAAETSPYGYLLKPFDERTLFVTIAVALERHASETPIRLLGAAVDSATIGILLVDAQGDDRQISLCNDAYVTMSGFSREALLGKTPCFLASAEPNQEGLLKLQQAMETRANASATVRGQRANGEPFWSSVTISPVADRGGSITHLLIFHMDITKQRDAETALADAQRLELVGRLSAGIAHDMNNVLGAIVTFADLAREGLDPDDERREDLDEVVHAAQRGALLTRKLLDFSRRDDDSPIGSADLTQVLAEIRPMMERLAGPQVEVQLTLHAEPMVVPIDATSIEQILLNLVANARDAMPDGGLVKVVATLPDEPSGRLASRQYARIRVTDAGSGMDEKTVERIFAPFFTTKPRGKGTGLGLSTCRMLMERAGGAISTQSEIGIGTTFTLDFPLTDRAIVDTSNDASGYVDGDANGATCLIVEDDHALRRAYNRALSDVGFHVFEASSGEAACRELDALGDSLGLLICDAVLPGIGGSEVLAHARQTSPTTPQLVVTGYFDHEETSFGPGARILWKPFTAATLARWSLDAIALPPAVEVSPAAPLPTFSQTLPQAKSAEEPRRPAVLLVEDDESLRKALVSVLSGRSLDVVEAGTGAHAIDALQAHEFQLAVVDINLPDTDGWQVLSAIRQRDPLVPTLVMTGDPSVESAQRALKGRATAFLTKPIVPGVFVEEVERALGEGQVARLQHKLLMTKAGAGALVQDFSATEAKFEASLAGLHMAYQPIVRAYDRSVYAYEALMRCSTPPMSPPEILAAAEVLGRVEELGKTIRRKVFRDIQAFDARHVQFFVNLHPMELRSELLLNDEEPLFGCASRITLEVTERAQLASTEDLASLLHNLRRAGFRLALDDLGEGYAGLSWLIRLTPDVAKLDMSLTREIDTSRMKRELVASLLSVCRRARTLVVAEGVETEAEATVLSELGCDLLQGYYFARPGPLPLS